MGTRRIHIPSAVFYLAPVSFTVAGTLIGFLREGYWGLVVGALLGLICGYIIIGLLLFGMILLGRQGPKNEENH